MQSLVYSRFSRQILALKKHVKRVLKMDYSLNGEGAAETNVGISKYANSAPGFQGIMKQRYSDFVVREVGLDGKVTALGNTSPAAIENLYFKSKNPMSDGENNSNEELVANVIREISEITGGVFGGAPADPLVPSETGESPEEEVKSFLFSCIEKAEDCPNNITACPCPDKATRTKLHQMVRKYLAAYIESEALEVGGAKFIQLHAKHKMGKGAAADRRSRNMWPESLGAYLKFTMFKENIDTMNAAHVIAKLLNCKVDSIHYAGTKDKRAITAQKVTMHHRKPSELTKLNCFNFPPYIRIGDFEYVHAPLRLGELNGNNFGIIMRDLEGTPEDVKAACRGIGESGFINYYGLQRFGSGGTKSHISGVALFRQDWKLVVELLFADREGDKPEMLELKKLFQAKDYKGALKACSYKMPSERNVLESLVKRPEDFKSAFQCIAKNQWLLCLHAYQSYVWNKAASERVSKYGMVVIEGDLVAGGEKIVEEVVLEDESEDLPLEVPVEVTAIEEKEDNGEKGDEGEKTERKKADVQIVTAEDVAAGKYTIFDIILPLPGHEVILPSNSIGTYMSDLLAEEGFSLEFFGKCQPSAHRMNGTYRRLIQLPSNFEWNFFEYNDPNEELVPTESAFLRQTKVDTTAKRGKKEVIDIPLEFSSRSVPYALTNLLNFQYEEVPGKYGPGDEGDAEVVVEKRAGMKFKGLQLKFTLPPGTYATMLIREITKHSTNSQYQTQLTATAAASFVSNTATTAATAATTIAAATEEEGEAPLKKAKIA